MLEQTIDELFEKSSESYDHADLETFQEFKSALNSGEARAAEPDPSAPHGWRVNAWVKRGILVGFRMGHTVDMSDEGSRLRFFDKSTFPPKEIELQDSVRVVPGGSSVRDGVYLGPSVTCMPPMYVNVGAYVGAGSMVDSHALVGSCAQVGRDVHVSAAAQLGGVLEPPNARPVIVEDGAFVGGGVGLYEGVLVRERAVLAAGVVLAATTPVFDLVHERELRGTREAPLEIPAGAVVVPGTRPASGTFARERGLALASALIVKYRDPGTDVATALEGALR